MKKSIILAALVAVSLFAKAQTETTYLSEDSINYSVNMDEIVINAHIPKGKVIIGGTSTRVVGSVLEKLGSARQVVEHLSGIKKKMNGTLEVIGKGVPVIYINGRQVRDLSELDRVKADELVKVDVLTSPGSAYNANDHAVINIKTKNREDGWAVDLSSQTAFSYRTDLGEQISGSYKQGKLELLGTVRYDMKQQRETATTNIDTHVDSLWQQRSTSVDHTNSQSLYGQIGMNYQASKAHTLGVMYEVTGMLQGRQTNHNLTDVMADGNSYDFWNTTEMLLPRVKPTHHANIYYKGKIREWKLDFDADMMLSGSKQHDELMEKSRNFADYAAITEEHTTNHLYAAKFTAAYPLWRGTFSMGSEWTLTNRHTDFTGYAGVLGSTDDDIQDQNLAFFSSYDISFSENTQLSLGLRYENVAYDFLNQGVKNQEESRVYNYLFPSLSFSTLSHGVRYAFNYRIQTVRPMYEMLKSAVNYGNRLTYLSGNPSLQPTYIHAVELGASYRDLNVQVGYNHYKDDTAFDVEQLEGNEKISINKFDNIRSRNTLTYTGSYAPVIGVWQPELGVAGTYQWYSTVCFNEKKNMNGAFAMLQLSNSFRLTHGWLLRVDGQWSTNGYMQNQYVHSSACLNMSLNKEWHDGAWSVLLEGTDLFRTQREASTFYFNKTQQYRETQANSRGVSLTIRYKLNGKNRSYQGVGAGNEERMRL